MQVDRIDRRATSQLARTTLRSVLGQHELDEMLAEREKLNHDIQSILDKQTDPWGVGVVNVEIKHVDLDDSMIRAIAKQAEAERTRRAKVIVAEGELQASEKLLQAAGVLAREPQAITLRYLQTMLDISSERSSVTCCFRCRWSCWCARRAAASRWGGCLRWAADRCRRGPASARRRPRRCGRCHPRPGAGPCCRNTKEKRYVE